MAKKQEKLSKTALIAAIAQRANVTKATAARVLDATLSAIQDTLAKGGQVSLVGFGSFTVAKRKARTGRNPRTGEKIKIPATKVVRFKPGRQLKDAVK